MSEVKKEFKSVSVCLASYNGSSFIERQLLSILKQLTLDDQIIVSDDYSTDNTLDIVLGLKDDRIKIFYNTRKKGPVGNFENALLNSTNDIILLADQDDVWIDGKVDLVRELLNEYDLVLSDCEIVDEKMKRIHNSFFMLRGSRSGFFHNLYKNSYIGCCMGFKRNILEIALPFPSKIHMHDWWIGLIAERVGRVYFCSNKLVQYVRHGQNYSPTGGKGYNAWVKLVNRIRMLWNVEKRVFLR